MKIDGTDASSFTHSIPQNSTVGTRSVKTVTKESVAPSSNIVLDNKTISQLTSADRRDLPISERVVIDAIEKANRAISGANRRFEFSIHDKTKEIVVKVIDSDTNEVIREIPNEKILDMVSKMWEMAGIIVDERR